MIEPRDAARRVWTEERGLSSVEHALILAFVGGGVMIGAILVGQAVSSEMVEAAECISACARSQ